MRKKKYFLKTIIGISLCLFLLVGCGSSESTEHDTNTDEVLQPLPALFTDQAGDSMPDGTYAVAFSGDDLKTTDDGYTLMMEFFNYDRYAKGDVLALQEGDFIYITVDKEENGTLQAVHENMKIDTLEVSEDQQFIDINGGLEQGGVELSYNTESGVYENRIWDGYPAYYSIGTGTTPLSKEMTLQDCIAEDTLPDGVITGYADLPNSLAEAEAKGAFQQLSTEAVIQNGEVVQLIRHWTP